MACHCNDCSSSKRIGTLRQLQVEKCVKSKGKAYPARSEKIWRERIKVAREWLIRMQAEVADAKEVKKCKPLFGYWHWRPADVDRALRILKALEAEAIRVLGKLPAAK